MLGSLLFLLVPVIVYFDAGSLQSRDSLLYRRAMGLSPGAWTALLLFLFPVAGPLYLLRRQRLLRRLAEEQDDLLVPLTERFETRIELVGVFVLWILLSTWLSLLVGLGLMVVRELTGEVVGDLTAVMIIGFLANVVFVAVLVSRFRQPPRRPFWRSLGWHGPARWLRWVVGPALLGGGMALGVGWLSSIVEDGRDPPLSGLLESASQLELAFFALTAILSAPLFEELIFRGYLYPALARLRGPGAATVLVTVLFALMHLEQLWGAWIALAGILVVGLVLTLLRAASGSTVPSTVAHLVYNTALLLVVPMLLLFAESPALFQLMRHGDELPPAQQEALMLQVLDQLPDNDMVMNDLAWMWAEQGRELDRALELSTRRW